MTALFVSVLHLVVCLAGSSRPGADTSGQLQSSAGTDSPLAITNGSPSPSETIPSSSTALALSNGSPPPPPSETRPSSSTPLALTNEAPPPSPSETPVSSSTALALTNGPPPPPPSETLPSSSTALAISNGSPPLSGGPPPTVNSSTALVDPTAVLAPEKPTALPAPKWPPPPAPQPDCNDPAHCLATVKKELPPPTVKTEEPPPPTVKTEELPPPPVGPPLQVAGEDLAPKLSYLAHLADERGFNVISPEQKKTYEDIIKKDTRFPSNSTITKSAKRKTGKEGSEFGKDGKKQIGLRFGLINGMLDGLATDISKARMLAGSEKSVIGIEANLQQFQVKGQTVLGDLKGSKKLASTVLQHFHDALSTARRHDNFKEAANADSIKELRDQVNSMTFPEKGSAKPPYNKNA